MSIDYTAFACYGIKIEPVDPDTGFEDVDVVKEGLLSKGLTLVEYGRLYFFDDDGGGGGYILALTDSCFQQTAPDFNNEATRLPIDTHTKFAQLDNCAAIAEQFGFKTIESPGWFFGVHTW